MASARRFVRVSTPAGHFSVPVAVAERAGSAWRALKQDAVDANGRVLASKPRADVEDTPAPRKRAPKPRSDSAAATPTPTESEGNSSATPEESA